MYQLWMVAKAFCCFAQFEDHMLLFRSRCGACVFGIFMNRPLFFLSNRSVLIGPQRRHSLKFQFNLPEAFVCLRFSYSGRETIGKYLKRSDVFLLYVVFLLVLISLNKLKSQCRWGLPLHPAHNNHRLLSTLADWCVLSSQICSADMAVITRTPVREDGDLSWATRAFLKAWNSFPAEMILLCIHAFFMLKKRQKKDLDACIGRHLSLQMLGWFCSNPVEASRWLLGHTRVCECELWWMAVICINIL